MTDPGSVMVKLDTLADELDKRSKEMAETEREMETSERLYEGWLGEWEANLWEESLTSETKFPPEKLRLRLAHRAMPAELLGTYQILTARRKRLERRISSIKTLVDAQRSILSALKEEMAASR